MREEMLTITNKIGLHARPAALLVKMTAGFKCDITLVKDGKSYNAKSLLTVMSAGVKGGETIAIRTHGEDEEAALVAIVALIKSGINE